MLARAIAAMLVALALTGPGFDGCSGSPSGGAVPPGSAVACFADSDCHPMACEQVGCVASQCVMTARIRDGDGDGHAPPPCGDDCDDSDALVFPSAPERCNGRDDDCDGMIDESAPPSAMTMLLGTASPTLAATAIEGSIVIVSPSSGGGLVAQRADFQGRLGAPITVIATAVDAFDVATTSMGGVLTVARSAAGVPVIEAYPITVSAGVLTVQPASTVAMPASAATRVRAAAAGTSFAVAWDDAMMSRFAMVPSWPAPASVGAAIAATTPLDVASDGTSVAVPSDASTVALLSASDGSVLHHQTFPAALASEPLSTAAHDYLVAFHDATDHQLAHLSETAVLATHAAPMSGAGLPLGITETALGPIVTRFDATNAQRLGTGAWALVMTDALDAVTSRFAPTMISPGVAGTALSVEVVGSASGTAVLTNYGRGGSVLTVLACMGH